MILTLGVSCISQEIEGGRPSQERIALDRVEPILSVAQWMFGAISSLGGCGGAILNRPGVGRVFRGRAAYYADGFAGRTTASGEIYQPDRLTAAHRTWPFGTRVRVTNQNNQRSVEVRINDRGPFGNRQRIIDLSRRAAEELRMIQAGVVPVSIEILSVPGTH